MNIDIQQDPLAVLETLETGKSLCTDLECVEGEPLPPESAELIIDEIRDQVAQLLLLEEMAAGIERGEYEMPHDRVAADFETYRNIVRGLLTEYIRKYGSNISAESRRIRAFYDEPNYSPEAPFNLPTYANFAAAREHLHKLRTEKKKLSAFFSQFKRKTASAVPGFESVVAHMNNGSTDLSARIMKVEEDSTDIWRSEEVRMAWLKRQHLEFISQLDEGRAVLETPTVIKLLNRIHEALFGGKAYKVSGPALVGPPGWGKTSMLQDYFRSFGLEPLSADIDPGQSAFSLMARPTLGLEKGLEEVKSLVEMVNAMSVAQIKTMYEMDPKKFKEVFEFDPEEQNGPASGLSQDDDKWTQAKLKIKTQLENKLMADFMTTVENLFLNKGYAYNLILKGLQQDKPVILNEFPELQEWTFLHGLLTAVPSADADAAPRPSLKPKEGEEVKAPKGWFFNTITGDWMRVPEHFRICFTGNIGVEYGNTGLPPALMSRIGGGLIQIDGLPPEELTRCIVWPLLSSKDTGRFLPDDETAYKLHFLITDFFPKLQAKLNSVADESFTIATREIIDLCRCLHPYHNQSPCSLDEALMRTLVRPCQARRFQESLKFIVAMLKGTGFLTEYKAELEQMDKSLVSERMEKIIEELKNPFRKTSYATNKKNFEGKCMVCGVLHCPVHGVEAKDFADFAEKASDLAKVGLDMRILNLIGDFLKKLFEKEQYQMFMELHIGNSETAGAVGNLNPENRKPLSVYVHNLIEELPQKPETSDAKAALTVAVMKTVATASKKLFIAKGLLNKEKLYIHANAFGQQTIEVLKKANAEKDSLANAGTNGAKVPEQKDMPLNKAAVLKIKTYLELKEAVTIIGLQFEDDEIADLLRDFVPLLDPKSVAAIAKLYPGNKELQAVVSQYANTNGESILAKFNEEKGAMFTDKMQANLKKSKNKTDRSLLAMPEFEMLYPKLIKLLDDAEAMLELGIITTSGLMEITRYAEYKMNQAVRSGFTPKSFTTYIRVIRKLAEIKKMKLDEIVAGICKPTNVPLPPMRAY